MGLRLLRAAKVHRPAAQLQSKRSELIVGDA